MVKVNPVALVLSIARDVSVETTSIVALAVLTEILVPLNKVKRVALVVRTKALPVDTNITLPA